MRSTGAQPVRGVLIRGFYARRYTVAGIVPENVEESRVEHNQTSEAPAKEFPAGILLVRSNYNSIAENFVSETHMFGIQLPNSHFNVVQGTR